MSAVYPLSSHPVWLILSQLNLPPEIINKIMKFNTVILSPINNTLNEFHSIRMFFENKTTETPFTELVATFSKLCFDCDDYDVEEHVTNYIYRFYSQFYTINNPKKILEQFLLSTIYYRISFHINTTRSLLEEILFSLMKWAYYDNIYRIYEQSYNKNMTDTSYYNLRNYKIFDNWRVRMFYKGFVCLMCNKLNIQKIICKKHLIGYCKVFGIKYYKSWTNKKLYNTLMTHEATGFNERYLDICT